MGQKPRSGGGYRHDRAGCRAVPGDCDHHRLHSRRVLLLPGNRVCPVADCHPHSCGYPPVASGTERLGDHRSCGRPAHHWPGAGARGPVRVERPVRRHRVRQSEPKPPIRVSCAGHRHPCLARAGNIYQCRASVRRPRVPVYRLPVRRQRPPQLRAEFPLSVHRRTDCHHPVHRHRDFPRLLAARTQRDYHDAARTQRGFAGRGGRATPDCRVGGTSPDRSRYA